MTDTAKSSEAVLVAEEHFDRWSAFVPKPLWAEFRASTRDIISACAADFEIIYTEAQREKLQKARAKA